MTKEKAYFVVTRYWKEVERESEKLLAHPFLSHRDWSSPAEVSGFVEALSAFVGSNHTRFEQIRGLYQLMQNEGDVSMEFGRYSTDGPGFVPIRTFAILLGEPSFRQKQSIAELNEIADSIVQILKSIEQRHKSETSHTVGESSPACSLRLERTTSIRKPNSLDPE